MFSGAAISADTGHLFSLRRLGAWTCALGVICLMGCQPRVKEAPPLQPVLAPAPPLPRPVRPTFYVTSNHLRLRACPGKDCPKTGILELNTAVEKMGEVENWTQIKLKKDGTIGYVSSRYLAAQPVKIAKHVRKRSKKARHRQDTQPPEPAGEAREAKPKQQEPSPVLPKVMQDLSRDPVLAG